MAARPGRRPTRPHRMEARRDGAPEFLGRDQPRERGAEHPAEAPDPGHLRLLADYDAAMEVAYAETEHAFLVAEGDWGERVRAALERLLTLAAREPEQTRLCTIRVFEAGPDGLRRRDAWMGRFTDLCRASYAETEAGAGRPALIPPVVAGALFELIRSHASDDRLAELPASLPTALVIVLAPVVGRDAALAAAA